MLLYLVPAIAFVLLITWLTPAGLHYGWAVVRALGFALLFIGYCRITRALLYDEFVLATKKLWARFPLR